MTDRLTLTSILTVPGGRMLVATHYLRDDEDLGAAVLERMAIPGCESVSVSRCSKSEILDHLREAHIEVEEVTVRDLATVN